MRTENNLHQQFTSPVGANAVPKQDRPIAAIKPVEPGPAIAMLLVKNGMLSEKQLRYAKRIKEKLDAQKSLITVLRELDYIDEQQVRDVLEQNRLPIRLGELLIEFGYLRMKDLKAALSIQKNSAEKRKLGEILLENHFVEEIKLMDLLALQLGCPVIDLDYSGIDKKLLRKVTPQWCKKLNLIPIKIDRDRLQVAFSEPHDQSARGQVERIFNAKVTPVLATGKAIRNAISAFERSIAPEKKRNPQEATPTLVAGLIDTMILDAMHANASDIHVEPMKEQLRVRFRSDGVLIPYKNFAINLALAFTSRLKVMANADIAEKRRHQDGRILFEDAKTGSSVDLRASFYTTIHGTKILMRLLSRKTHLLSISEVGMAPKVLVRFCDDVLDVPSGVILITGPTGSGKTTTLYSCVNYLNDIERSIITAEDPVEYVIDGIGQCSLNPKIDVTFENTLPHMVRQDPDVIVLGEIRDRFSAEAAIQAALTGHKVLTTFHTEDSIGGLLRLMNMNIETFLISSTVVSVLAQRLLRKVCSHCAEPHQPTPGELRRMRCSADDFHNAQFRQGGGCEQCRFTGYQGRIGVHELLVLNEHVKDAILNKKTSYEIRRVSVESSGLITLFEDGLMKAAQGKTTIAEVLRHLPRLDKPRPLNELLRLTGK